MRTGAEPRSRRALAPGRFQDEQLGQAHAAWHASRMIRAAPLRARGGGFLVGATTFVVSSDALAAFSPGVLTVLRFAFATVFLLPLGLRRGRLGRVLATRTATMLGL